MTLKTLWKGEAMKKKGFSLIELMIVVAIIGVLSAIAIPSFMNYILKSKQSEYSTIIDGIAHGEALYNIANDSFIVVGLNGNGTVPIPCGDFQLNDDPQPLTAIIWAVEGQNIGYMPDKMFYGNARAPLNVPGPPTPNLLLTLGKI
jgi:prepilin-type N-terminal cleavage/methylation domain-containing protein